MAQGQGSLRGQVLDPSGAAVPRATVTVTGASRVAKTARSDNDGTYAIAGLPPGQYTIRATAAGFSAWERTAVDLPGERASTLDITLSLATAIQEVTIADTQQVELDPARNAGALVLKEGDLDALPDDPDDLQADLQALAGPAAGPNGGQIFIDGFSNGQLPPKDSIREIRINSNPFSSEYDRPGRGRIEIFTKPGTDKFRGMAQLNYGDSIWNSRNPYAPSKPYYNTQNLNANLSGPLAKRASFFLDFSRRYMKDSELVNAQVVDPVTFAVRGLSESIISPNRRTSISPRIDYQVTPNITLQGRYSWTRTDVSNQGVGGINLPSTSYSTNGTTQIAQLTTTWVVNARTINETRFQLFRQRQDQTGDNPVLNVQVNSAFSTGSNFPLQYQHRGDNEFQNYTSIAHGTQFIKFGVRIRGALQDNYSTTNYTGQLVFTSLDAYIATLQGLPGSGPSQYIQARGNPLVGGNQVDAGLFFQDDWKLLPSLTLSLGARYEVQNNIGDKRDLAPRIGVAWGIGPGQGRLRQPKTVLRAGYGWFYERFPINNTLTALRYNGVNQQQYIISSPVSFPAPPPLTGSQPLNTYVVDSNLRGPLLEQTAIGIDRQLPKNITLSVNYINSRGLHELRTVVYPPGAAAAGVLDLYSSSGNFKQKQLIVSANARINAKFSLYGYYAYGHVHTDVNGSPSNPYDFAADWGRAGWDIRHSMNLNGSLALPFGLRLSPNITMSSAPPFNITQGVDQFGNSLYNSRPAFVPPGFSAPACTSQLANAGVSCIAASPLYGSFVVNPKPGMTVIPANYGTAFAQVNVNMRLTRTWGWGERATAPRPNGGGPRGPGFGAVAGRGGGGGGPRGGGGGRFFGGGDASGKKYTVTAGLFVRNVLNTWNPGDPEGNLLSPRFGQTLALAGGGGTQSANRRIELTLRFSF